jgi:hypothetical protein
MEKWYEYSFFFQTQQTARSPEMSENVCQTIWRHIPQYSFIHNHRRQNLKSHESYSYKQKYIVHERIISYTSCRPQKK